MDFQEMLSRARSLRDQAFRAEMEFRLFMVEFEASGLHEAAGFSTFSKLIVAYKLGTPEGHDAFKKGLAVVPKDVAPLVGVHIVSEAGGIRDGAKRKEFIASALKRVEEVGFPHSQEQAAKLHQSIEPTPGYRPENLKRESREAAKIAELDLAVQTLREENRALKSENAKLKARLAKLEKKPAQTVAARS